MRPVTYGQLSLLAHIHAAQVSGYNPTIRELGVALGCRSPNAVVEKLRALERRGLIWRSGEVFMTRRPIHLTKAGEQALGKRGSAAPVKAAASTMYAALKKWEACVATVDAVDQVAAWQEFEALARAALLMVDGGRQ